ncbi:MAG: transpeptidase family protein [Treponema sp.]|jgi:cell division protein FtsI (penicillin-binding protein 3)|nr:transpeptidase family protein [Treponema sp.]
MNTLVKWRFNIVVFLLLAVTVFILSRYAFHLIKGDSGQGGPARATVERGKILDRNGKILASQINLHNVYVLPPPREEIYPLAMGLAPILDMTADEIYASIDSARGNFLLKRQISASSMEMIRNEQRSGRLKGVSTLPVQVRVYPEKNLAAQIIGFTGSDNIGREGAEYAFNRELSAGNNVALTIDINVQHILEKVASATLSETQAESVMFLAMDPRGGEVLGSAVLPGFDPNNYRDSASSTYLYLPAHEQYEPGSVFKVFSISALMDSGVITENSEFTCNGVYERTFPSGEKVRIECADGRAHGRVRPREIIIHSCNVGAALAADRQDNQSFYRLMLNYGFGARTGAWISSASASPALTETAGLLKNPEIPGLWSGRTRQSIAFGQEIAVSALQVIQAASVIANNGTLVPPKLILQITSADGRTVNRWENSVNANRQVIRMDTTRTMLTYMANTATDIGTGWRASVEDLNLAVKTGTSQYRDPMTGGYSRTDFIASCIALLPAEFPSLILYVVIVKPRGETYGGRIAAPAIREAAEQLIDYLGIPRGRNPFVEHPGSIEFAERALPHIGPQVPNFYGLSKKTLLPLLIRSDIRVEIFGEGWVRSQSPAPGTPIAPDTIIELTLE